MRRRAAAQSSLPGATFVFTRRPARLLIIVALLVVIGVSLLRKARDPRELSESARIERATQNLAMLRIAVERFRYDTGRYPTTREGLAALMLNPGVDGWNGPYVLRLLPDPWQRPFEYHYANDQPILRSLGADGIPGSEHDLMAPPPPSPEVLSNENVYRLSTPP